jgi:hypothetical protein
MLLPDSDTHPHRQNDVGVSGVRYVDEVQLGCYRKAIAVMRAETSVKRSASRSWGAITPLLMRRAVKQNAGSNQAVGPRAIFAIIAMLLFPVGSVAQDQWFRGNTHVHTDNSDGDASPNEVVRWYKEHGYHFVVITDHDERTPVQVLNDTYGVDGQFIVLAGVEVSDRIAGRPVHLNGLGVRETVRPQGGETVSVAIDANADAIATVGGLPVLNHPNGLLRVALTMSEIAQAREVRHFEVCCADYLGGSGHPSTDAIWDGVLSRGHLIYGIAADDAHSFGTESRDPGSAWIMVRATTLTATAILDAVRVGAFYATTGVTLHDVRAERERLCVSLPDAEEYGFHTVFIGDGGAELAHDETAEPCYEFRQEDTYVRARIQRSDGAIAWTQPVFLR